MIKEKKTLYYFSIADPDSYELIDTYESIDDFETIFKLTNGKRVIYDELFDNMIYLQPRVNRLPYLTEEEYRAEFSRRVSKKILCKGINKNLLTEILGISRPTLDGYLCGKRLPNNFIIYRLSIILNCNVSELTNFDYLL